MLQWPALEGAGYSALSITFLQFRLIRWRLNATSAPSRAGEMKAALEHSVLPMAGHQTPHTASFSSELCVVHLKVHQSIRLWFSL